MKFENSTDCARYYLYELLKSKEGELFSVKQIKEYGRSKSGKVISDNTYSGLLKRESDKVGTGIIKVKDKIGYYYYDSTSCKNNSTEEWILNAKEILKNTVDALKIEISKVNALTADINTLVTLRDTIDNLEKLSESL